MAQYSNGIITQTTNNLLWANIGLFTTLANGKGGFILSAKNQLLMGNVEVYIGDIVNPNIDAILSNQNGLNINNAAVAGYNVSRRDYSLLAEQAFAYSLNYTQTASALTNVWVRMTSGSQPSLDVKQIN